MSMSKRNFSKEKKDNGNEGKILTFKRLTVEDLSRIVKELYKGGNTQKNYFIYTGEKGSKVIELYYKFSVGLISEDECYVRTKGIMENAYIHPEWDYWSKPIAWKKNIWKDFRTNEIVEIVEENEYGEETLNISGRRDWF